MSISPEMSPATRVAAETDDEIVRLGDVSALAPISFVCRKHGLHVRFPTHELERAGAVRVPRRVRLLLGVEVLRALDVVLLRPGLAHEAQVRELQGQDRRRLRREDVDGKVVHLASFGHVRERGAVLRLRVEGALHVENDVVGAEGRAVVEFHARPQLEAPTLACIERRPRQREPRSDLPARVAIDQRLVDLAQHPVAVQG
jgi:hypothetical protein